MLCWFLEPHVVGSWAGSQESMSTIVHPFPQVPLYKGMIMPSGMASFVCKWLPCEVRRVRFNLTQMLGRMSCWRFETKLLWTLPIWSVGTI